MSKRNKSDDDEEYYRSDYLGIGSYQRIGSTSGKTKMKNVIGFIRPKVKTPKQPAQKKK